MKAKIFTSLLYRHWTAFTDFKRSHLFVISAVSRAGEAESTPHATSHLAITMCRRFNLGGQDMYAVSPDGQEVAYTCNLDEVGAISTNNDIFLVPITRRHAEENFYQSG